MQYRFERGNGHLKAIILDREDTDLEKTDLTVKNLKTFQKLTIDNGLIKDPQGKEGQPYALIPEEMEGLLGNFDLDDLRLYAKKREEIILEGFE